MLASVLKIQLPPHNVGTPAIISKDSIRALVYGNIFWTDITNLSTLLELFSKIVVAIQAKGVLLADVFR